MNAELTAEQEKMALRYEPFGGDETDVTGLTDKFVTGRKEHECFHCRDVIAPGERHRAKTERNNEERKIETFRFCGTCCATFATFEGPEGDDKPMMVRFAQGRAVDDARHVAQKKPAGCRCYLCQNAPTVPQSNKAGMEGGADA